MRTPLSGSLTSLTNGSAFALFDGARQPGGSSLLFQYPVQICVAREPAEVRPVLAQIRRALAAGWWCAGFLAYEAGLSLEPALHKLVRRRTGQPLIWFASFPEPRRLTEKELLDLLPKVSGDDLVPTPLIAKTDYLQSVRTVLDYIGRGDIYQLNMTFQTSLGRCASALGTYRMLRSRQNAKYGGVLMTGEQTLLSFSPELFFSIESRLITARPMKGTTPRAQDAREDQALREFLRSDVKNRAENLMIVDLMRNDLSRIAQAGTVSVSKLFEVETYPTVHQMTSTVTAMLKDRIDAIAVIEALFPCGSITGAPKVRAMELINDIEAAPRSAYTGSFGWLAPDGDACLNVAIRTITVENSGEATLGLGSGVVSDSDPEAEWLECLQKAAFLTI